MRPVQICPLFFSSHLRISCIFAFIFAGIVGRAQTGTFAQSAVNLGSLPVNSPAPSTATLTFTFKTRGEIRAPEVMTQGAKNLDFTDAGTGTCTTNGTSHTYLAGNTCTVDVNFIPGLPGLRPGAVLLYNSESVPIATEYLYGVGTGSQVVFSRATLALSPRFSYIWGMAVDGAGNLYVGTEKAITEFPADCNSYTCLRTVGGGFTNLTALLQDGAGTLYVINGSYLEKLPADCTSSSCVTKLRNPFSGSRGLVADKAGNLYSSETGPVQKLPAGCTSSSCVIQLGGGFDQPGAPAVDGSGNVYLWDWNNGYPQLKEIPAGCFSSSCVTILSAPDVYLASVALAVDANGNIYSAVNGAVSEMPAGCASSSCAIQLGSDTTWFGATNGNGNFYSFVYYPHTGAGIDYGVTEVPGAHPPSVTYGLTVRNQTGSTPRSVTLRNIGNLALTFPVPSSGSNPSISAPFLLGNSGENLCPVTSSEADSAGVLAPNLACNLSVVFTPPVGVAASYTGSLVLTDDALNGAAPGYATQTIALNGSVTDPPFGAIGKVVDATTLSNTVWQFDDLLITGWAADDHDGAPVSRIAILLDGYDYYYIYGFATLGLPRPDVAEKYNGSYFLSGWSMTIPSGIYLSGEWPVGTHTIQAVAYDSQGLSAPLDFAPVTFTVSDGQTWAPPIGAMSKPVDSATRSTTVAQIDHLLVTGWAADAHDGAPVSKVTILVDGAAAGPATLGVARPDVAAAENNPALLHSGWSYFKPAAGLSVGSHTLAAVATDSLGYATTFGPATITVSATQTPGPPFGSLDKAVDATTGSTTVRQSDNLFVSGWAADFHDHSPVHKVSILIDGAAVGDATLGIARPDVAKKENDSKYTNSGWQFTLPASSLTAGVHTITAIATDSLALSSQFQIRVVTVTP